MELFRDEMDRKILLARLGIEVEERLWVCHAFCLLNTHYHLLVETPEPDLANGLHRLNGRYAWTFNTRSGRKGHVFEKRYHASLIESQGHLLEVVRYIALNPVRAGACRAPEEWSWSSYRATAGLEDPPSFLTVGWILAQFAFSRSIAQARYRTHVADGMNRPRWPPAPVPGTVPGTGTTGAGSAGRVTS